MLPAISKGGLIGVNQVINLFTVISLKTTQSTYVANLNELKQAGQDICWSGASFVTKKIWDPSKYNVDFV